MTDDPRAYQGKSADRGLQPDGRRLWVFSQSAIKAVEICPERGRQSLLRLRPRTYTDSTAMGEGVHLAIELCLSSVIEGQGPLGLEDVWQVACDHIAEVMAAPGSRFVKIKTLDTLYQQAWRCLSTFYAQVLPTLSPLAVEVKLGPLTIYEDESRVIALEGTADYLDAVTGLGDWKTAGREWEAREHQRWDTQPTVYTWLWRQGTTLPLHDWEEPWTWHVFYTNGKYEPIPTTRNAADWAWLKDRCLALAIQLEAELPVWAKNSSHWLCSANYCEAFAECRGRFHER